MSFSSPPLGMVMAITLVMAAAVMVEGNTKSDCGVAQTAFGMCVPYVIGEERGVSPSCCAGVRSVKELSPTLTAKRSVCDCLRAMMAQVGKIDTRRAAGLAGKCRIKTNVIPTSLGFRCFELA